MNSAVVNQIEQDRKLQIAYGDDLRIIQQLIPLLQYRKEIAKKYFNTSGKSEEFEKNLLELLERINNDISKVIGV